MHTQPHAVEKFFDPFRLKMIVMPSKEANPFGKNPDYFFLKGLEYTNQREFSSAIAAYEKGLEIKSENFLCRFNLGYVFFKMGLFQEALKQYQIMDSQGHTKKG